ncbi:MAG: peptide/nickel transport system permease protein [Saprospiraceae bacterium]|jgi:peptide/nickel transport system permease protein
MLRFITKRLLQGIAVLFLVVIIISSIIYLAPVEPERLTFGQRYDLSTMEAKKKELGLDRSLFIQLLFYIRDISPISFHENNPQAQDKYNYIKILPLGANALVVKLPYLRESFQSGRSVSAMLFEKLPQTAILALVAILLGLLVGIILGIISALNHNNWFDNSAVVSSVIGISIPSYVSAMILALVFAYYFKWFEVSGSLYGLDDFGDKKIFWKNLVLPAIALGIRPIAIITQLTRSAMLDVLSQDYIRTAKAKGLSYYKVVFKHALRNALNPVLTAASGWFAALLAGAFFVENVFDYNGLGQLTVNALLSYDIPLVLGAVLLTACIFVVLNILVDVLYAVLDPRVRFQE